ncbi:MAG TPA: nuclear transport factor 2 family protein [Candidatus Baltobacteraceae bacterium]|nr:nuclear transport factor 2 family protein [Candidatus Baltobacteraceae bacterium]
MKFRFAALFFALTAALPAGTAAAPAPAYLKVVAQAIAASNGQDPAAFDGLYAPGAAVVDEEPPYVWNGAGAGHAWFAQVLATLKRLKMTAFHAAALPPTEVRSTADAAYAVVPVDLKGTAPGKRFQETGTLTFTLRRDGSSWKITSQVWTTRSSAFSSV